MISQRFSQIFWFHGTAHTRSILILLHQQRKGFQRKWSHFPGSGRQSQIMQTTIRCHCHTATTPQPQICPREKNLPEKKQMPKEIKIAQDKKCLRKKNYQEMMLPLQPHLSRKYQNTGTFHPKGGISLQSAPKEEVRIRYLIFVISYTNTIMSKLFFWLPNIFILWLPNMPHFWEELLCWKQIQFNNINTVKLTLDGCQFCRWWGTAKFFY